MPHPSKQTEDQPWEEGEYSSPSLQSTHSLKHSHQMPTLCLTARQAQGHEDKQGLA